MIRSEDMGAPEPLVSPCLGGESVGHPRVAVLCNPLSGRVRRNWAAITALRADVGTAAYREASTPGEIAAALDELALRPDDALAVIGGDGTTQALLTALHSTMPERPWPVLIPLPAGSTNMTALDLGAVGALPATVTALRRWRSGDGTEGQRVQRPLLLIERHGHAPLCGMFFGTAKVAEGVRFFRHRLRGRGVASERTSSLSILRVLFSLARGGSSNAGDYPIRCRVDDDDDFDANAILVLVSTLHRLLLGMRPYWGGGNAPLHFTLVERNARALWRSLWRLASGRPGRTLTPERGYFSRDAERVAFHFDGPFVVDGEVFEARSADGPLVLTAPRVVEWMVMT